MRRTSTVTVGEHYQDFCESLVKSGRYGSVSDVMRAGLRLLERQEREEALTKALHEGLNSGVSPHSIDDILNKLKGNDESDGQKV